MLWGLVAIAAVGFFCLFSPWTQAISFWPVMGGMGLVLAGGSLVLSRGELKKQYAYEKSHLVAGVISAILLYGVFGVGHFLSVHLLPFAAGQVDSIYAIREGQNKWLIAVLLLCVIGPAEEIFWRGCVQRRLSEKYGLFVGFVAAAALYTLVHLWSFNLMLLVAAAVCGLFWGLLYAATDRLCPCIISHAVWDVLIFILLPIHS